MKESVHPVVTGLIEKHLTELSEALTKEGYNLPLGPEIGEVSDRLVQIVESDEYADSSEFTSDLNKATELVAKLKTIVCASKWKEYMKATDEHYGTDGVALTSQVQDGIEAFLALEEQLTVEIGK